MVNNQYVFFYLSFKRHNLLNPFFPPQGSHIRGGILNFTECIQSLARLCIVLFCPLDCKSLCDNCYKAFNVTFRLKEISVLSWLSKIRRAVGPYEQGLHIVSLITYS